MSVFNPNKSTDKIEVKKGDSFNVNISFESKSELINTPSDIIIVFDRSSSMEGENIIFAKAGLKDLIHHVVEASDGIENVRLGNNTRIGLISFAFNATVESYLTSDVSLLNSKINNMEAPGGKTNHEEAMKKAITLVDKSSTNRLVVVVFTDADTTFGSNPLPQFNHLKELGAEIFCLGLTNKPYRFRSLASSPYETHVVTTKEPGKIEDIFSIIAYEVIVSGAYNIIIDEQVNDLFEIVSINSVSRGIIDIVNNKSFKWNIDAAGINNNDKVDCSFLVKYIGNITGTVNINDSIIYKDRENNSLIFPSPSINVIYVDNGCNDTIIIDKDSVVINDLGRIISISFRLKNVCLSKDVAIGVILTEIDNNNIEYIRGFKSILLPKNNSKVCEDIFVKCINFVVPEVLDKNGNINSICNNRNFKVRIINNYVNSGFKTCLKDEIILNNI